MTHWIKMIFKILCLYLLLYLVLVVSSPHKRCLTGYMTDVQSWVDEEGRLTSTLSKDSAIDVTEHRKAVNVLSQRVYTSGGKEPVRYVSLANCGLRTVPEIFNMQNRMGIRLAESLEYLTLYGNEFGNVISDEYDEALNATGARESSPLTPIQDSSNWYYGFQQQELSSLRELDLRACSIQVLNRGIFQNMPQLEALYLSENRLVYIRANAFQGLNNLIHLDLSRNNYGENNGHPSLLTFESMDIFQELRNLSSLDFSFTRISTTNMHIFRKFGKKFKRLSVCGSSVKRLPDDFYGATSIMYLDVSGNHGIFNDIHNLEEAGDTLQVLYAEAIGIKTLTIFKNIKGLEILKVDGNEIDHIDPSVAITLKNLQALYLDSNRISAWFFTTLSYMPKLNLLSLRNNNINVITDAMIEDFNKIKYLSLSENFFVCNCQVMQLYNIAMNSDTNHTNYKDKYIFKPSNIGSCNGICYHTGFDDINRLIRGEKVSNLKKKPNKTTEITKKSYKSVENSNGLTLFDYNLSNYGCLLLEEGKSVPFAEFNSCVERRAFDEIERGRGLLLFILLVPGVLMPLLAFVFMFRRKIKYFFITLRNSATLSVINEPIEDAIYFYDVFVSYCHDDRDWVLDKLLPHVEKDYNINVCLHERDFQVGLSIMENIISCMDRSRLIVLVLSMEFLNSQWCKFEMHLAQHRLLETRREDLILILLEDIPRHIRPNTLQYLMLTKTYIIWPKEQEEQEVFWKRLKKSLTMYRNIEKVSVA